MVVIIGVIATCLSSWAQPVQAIHVWRHRNQTGLLSGVSLFSLMLITFAASCWIGYGFRFQGFFAAVLAFIEVVCQSLILGILVYAGVLTLTTGILFVGFLLVACMWAIFVPVVFLGAMGASLSLGMFVPQAIKMWRNRRNPAAFAVSPWTSLLMIVANILWLLYGVLLQDVWLSLPCVIHVFSSVVMFYVSKMYS